MNRLTLSFCLFAALLLATSCAQTQKVTPEANNDQTVVSATPPFQTKEPERYRATRTTTTSIPDGETLVIRNWIARDGKLRRDETEWEGRRVVYLDLGATKFALLPNEKLFADMSEGDQTAIDGDEDLEGLHDRLLHTDSMTATYQRIGSETIGGRNTQKYRVVVNSSSDANVSVSETVIWVDDALQMPIRSEMKSADGTRSTTELSDIALEVDPGNFQVPEGYQKITFEELLKRLKLD